MNYIEQHAERIGLDSDKLERVRVGASKASPMGDTLDLCARYADSQTLQDMVRAPAELVALSPLASLCSTPHAACIDIHSRPLCTLCRLAHSRAWSRAAGLQLTWLIVHLCSWSHGSLHRYRVGIEITIVKSTFKSGVAGRYPLLQDRHRWLFVLQNIFCSTQTCVYTFVFNMCIHKHVGTSSLQQ